MKLNSQSPKVISIVETQIHTALKSAVAQLDLRGTNPIVTQALCIIDVWFEALAKGVPLSAEEACAKGMEIATQLENQH